MSRQSKKPNGCGCLQIPISLILLLLGGSYWGITNYSSEIGNLLNQVSEATGINVSTSNIPFYSDIKEPQSKPEANSDIEQEIEDSTSEPDTRPSKAEDNNSEEAQEEPSTAETENQPPEPEDNNKKPQEEPPTAKTENQPSEPEEDNDKPPEEEPPTAKTENQPSEPEEDNDKPPEEEPPTAKTENQLPEAEENNDKNQESAETNWEKKDIRGIYLGRYQVTNNASEQTIRERVRYYRDQGFNTIIHGVWGNGCSMYNSKVMQEQLGMNSCPNEFRDRWLNWLIDEAHKHDMEVHAYFEKGIKIDENSPIFDLAIEKNWLVPGVDRTYDGVDHYVIDLKNTEIADFYSNILVEFVKKYPEIDAVQWDDYVAYHAELPGEVDRTDLLTQFAKRTIAAVREANPSVSFDISHHNPYWAERYFAANWKEWDVDRAFIQAYNEENFEEELKYVEQHDGVSITDQQLSRLPELIENEDVNSILVFPFSTSPKETASKVKSEVNEIKSENNN